MKFKLEKTSTRHSKLNKFEMEEKIKYEKLGFTFAETEEAFYNTDICPEIEINTFEQLMAFIKEYGDIILNSENGIEIYDFYRE